MLYEVSDIIDDVRKVVDEIGRNDADLLSYVDQDNAEMDAIIVSKVREAVDWAHGAAPAGMIREEECVQVDYKGDASGNGDDKYTSDEKMVYHKDGMLSIRLKREDKLSDVAVEKSLGLDFLRLVYADVYGVWPYPVATVVDSSEGEFVSICDKYVGASYERPAVTLGHEQSGEKDMYKVLQLRKLSDVEDYAHVALIERCEPKWYANGQEVTEGTTDAVLKVEVNEPLLRAVCYRLGGLLLATYREDYAKQLFALGNAELGLEQRESGRE